MDETVLRPVDEPVTEAPPKNERSTIGFPYGDLDDAVQVAKAVHDLGDKCTHDQLAPKLKYSSVQNGAFLQKLAAARHFGFINNAKDSVTLTALGHRVVDQQQEARARADAFLTVPLYRAVYDQYKGNTLPPTQGGLETVLVGHGVAEKQKDKARQALLRSAAQSGFFNMGRERLVYPSLTDQPPVDPAKDSTPATPEHGNAQGGGGGGGGSTYPTLIKGLLEKLPQEGGSWTSDEREQWLKAIALILDMVYTTKPLALPAPSNGSQPISADQVAV